MAAAFARLKRFGPELAGLAALALVVLLHIISPAPFERLRLQVFDLYQRTAPREQADGSRVAVVDIDEESIVRLGQWPWPRTELAELNHRLGEAGAAAVVYDIVLSEPDRTSPAQVAADYRRSGRGDALGEAFARLPSHDTLLAESFGEVPTVTAFFLETAPRGRVESILNRREIEPKAGFTLHGTLPKREVTTYRDALQALPELEGAAAGNGFVTLVPDPDGIVRRVPMVAIYRDALVPGLSLEGVRVARRAGSPDLVASDGTGETRSAPGAAVSIRVGDIEIPVSERGEIWVHYPPQDSQKMLPAWSIIQGATSDSELKGAVEGRIVFVGGSATGLQDLVSTPVSERTAGVTVHAAATEQILGGDFLERPDWAVVLERALAILAGLLLALFLPRLGAARGALVALLGVGAVAAGSWLAFTQANYLLDATLPALALVAVYSVQTVAVFNREERQRRYIHAAFDRFLSPEMVRQIAADPGKLELGGEERDMSVLMCDIRGFSRISERLPPKQVIDFLIGFLTPMSDILLARRATLDKYIGDAILAFWNAPLDDPDHHANAARAALEMIAKTDELNRTMPGRKGVIWPAEIDIGIGLNSGLCCVGNMGTRQHLSYSLIGDTVNVASRLEGLTKQYGVPIIVGDTLAERLAGFALLELDCVRLVGRDEPESIFALLGDDEALRQAVHEPLVDTHSAMLKAYRARDWDKADAALAAGCSHYEALGLSELHELFSDRIAALRAQPPGNGWDGVFQVTQK